MPVRVATPMRSLMMAMCLSTVFSEMERVVAMSLLLAPAPTTLGASLVVHGASGEQQSHVVADLTIQAPSFLRFTQEPAATTLIALYDGAMLDADLAGGAETLEFRGLGTVVPRGMTTSSPSRATARCTSRATARMPDLLQRGRAQ